jgi:hypothetical protein
MNKFLSVITIIIALSKIVVSQPFNGDGIAIHKDSSIIVSWAVSATVERGYINIADTSQNYTEGDITSNKAFFGSIENVVGKANGQFLSLGDGGSIIMEFESPIINGQGPDFAVFENAIFTPANQTKLAFIELAFVEVSSDGFNYERFPAVSNQAYEEQIGTFDPMDWSLFQNLAGVYPVFYGYPFDLDDIKGEIVDKSNITHVRIIDAVGSIDTKFANYDSRGNIINDPWPTPFHSCGFDLDAVAVINQANNSSNQIYNNTEMLICQDHTKDFITIKAKDIKSVCIFDMLGKEIINQQISNNQDEYNLNTFGIKHGIYILVVECGNIRHSKKIIIND